MVVEKIPKYGRQPPMCQSGHTDWCHGPHMYEALWTLAPGSDAANMNNWRRSDDFVPFFFNHYIFGQPTLLRNGTTPKQVFIGGGAVFSQLMHRSVGIATPANSRFKLPSEFTGYHSKDKLFVNADVSWPSYLREYGCDEGCAAYLAVQLEADSGTALQGYSFQDCDFIYAQDGIIPVTWNGSGSLPSSGKPFYVKIMTRASVVFGVYVGNDPFNPSF